MIYDVITYNGEKELFEIRYNILKDYVDEFRVIEFDKTFSGKDKKISYLPRYEDGPRVRHFFKNTDEVMAKYEDWARSSPNTEYGKGANHWIREFCQKESIKDCLTDLRDDDIVFIGDVDEIWDPIEWLAEENVVEIKDVAKIGLRVYSYYLNNRSSEVFQGTVRGFYKYFKGECLNHLRVNARRAMGSYGWHFTSMGGHENVKKKLTDSYTKETYASDVILDGLKNNIDSSKDFLGRNFTYTLDESEWPQYLKDNKEKYKDLCLY